MKKLILFLLLLIYNFGFSQNEIHIGQSSRSIYNYYKNKGYDIKFHTIGNVGSKYKKQTRFVQDKQQFEILKLNANDVEVTYFYDDTNICINQDLRFKTKEAYYKACDYYNVSDVYLKTTKVLRNNKTYAVFTSQIESESGLIDSITISKWD